MEIFTFIVIIITLGAVYSLGSEWISSHNDVDVATARLRAELEKEHAKDLMQIASTLGVQVSELKKQSNKE